MGVIRLFLALVVAADHWRAFVLVPAGQATMMTDYFKLGFNSSYAVMFFYVISGFLITYTLSRNYDRTLQGASQFYRKRFIRIFSLYWPVVLFTFWLVPWAWQAFVAAGPLQQISAIFLIGMDWQLSAGIKNASIVGLEQAWTLGAELVFYIAAPFLMRSWKIGLSLLVVSLGFRAVFVLEFGSDLDPTWTYAFPGSTFCFFMLGHLVCLASGQSRLLSSRVFGWTMLVLSVAAMLWAGNYVDFDGRRLWLSVLFFTLALPGVFAATSQSGWINELGELSYPIYLVHILPILADVAIPIERVTRALGGSPYVSTASFLVVVLGCAIVVLHLFERPVAYLMTRILIRRIPASA